MKALKYLTLILFTTLSSCNMLDVEPKDFLSPEQYYNTEEELKTALTGVYSTFVKGGTFLNNLGRMGLDADEVYNYREQNSVADYLTSPNDSKILNFWRDYYAGITRANMLLKNIDKATTVDKAKRDIIKGEALFLRGFFYFMLVQNFGDVPLILQPIETSGMDEIQTPRTPAKQVYDQIISDMTQASELVEDISKVGNGSRVNKSAVYGMLARVCLYMAGNPINEGRPMYEEARKWAKKVMDNPVHKLNNSYQDVFVKLATDQYDIGESIFEIEFYGNGQGIYATLGGFVGIHNGIQNNNTSNTETNVGQAYAYLQTTAYVYNTFEEGDLRRDWAIAPFTYTAGTDNEVYYAPGAYLFNRFIGKFRRVSETLKPKHAGRTPQNYPVLRFSDVLLMFAEAENEINGPTEDAVNAVNEVRRRGYGKLLYGERLKTITITNGGSGYTSAPTVSITGGDPATAATATAAIASGKVTSITISNPGTFYKTTSPVVITISGGGGTGATATATITSLEEADLTMAQKADDVSFREMIYQERTRELAFENMRKADLVRWGILIKKMKESLADANTAVAYSSISRAKSYFGNASERDVLWPIPGYEIGVNPKLTQNPGY
ncbi:RagB/SusD family nutrient uptake outer membrane protein [Pseudopedobacter sp.]|uniref:RagB/SusD family nutrient uptake outer membrane protein n=1 Tax=Pseudopedobacter sp. TaxID=1936787 RepID=UPI00333EBD41